MTGGNAACGVFPRHRDTCSELASARCLTARQDRHRLRGAHSHTLHRDTAVRRLLQGGENPAASHPPQGGVDAAAGVNDTGRITHSISARAISTVSVQTHHARGGDMRASACNEHRQRRVFRERVALQQIQRQRLMHMCSAATRLVHLCGSGCTALWRP